MPRLGTLAVGAKARTLLRMRAPSAVLGALGNDWHGDRPEVRHEATMPSFGRRGNRDACVEIGLDKIKLIDLSTSANQIGQ